MIDINIIPDLLRLKENNFVLWRPNTTIIPKLVIGKFELGNPSRLTSISVHEFSQHPEHPDIWVVNLGPLLPDVLQDGQVYHYFFEVHDSSPYKTNQNILCTDPTAWTVDWRLMAPRLSNTYGEEDRDPASVVMVMGNKLVACDAGGEIPEWGNDTSTLPNLPINDQVVIYELPTAWSRTGERGIKEIGVGSFCDILSLLDADALPANFAGIRALEVGAHLVELGINALELLPPADSWVDREWGYGTSNYLAADFDLGLPSGNSWSTATTDLSNLIKTCHRKGIRFLADMAMGFACHCPLENVDFMDFHVKETKDPGEVDPEKDSRQNWGGQLFTYNYEAEGYDPVNGGNGKVYPARQYMKVQLAHWMNFYRIDGIRMDSVKTIMNWDFIQEFKDAARDMWIARSQQAGLNSTQADPRFIVVGEVLDSAEEKKLVDQNRVDAIWNDSFKKRVRHAIMGKNSPEDSSFEQTIARMVSCHEISYSKSTQIVNYVGSHDTEGFQNERLCNFLQNNQIYEAEQRIKLAFVCLLTAAGIPMILAGDEFAEISELESRHPFKQINAVNFERREEPWRRRVFDYVANLVHFRTQSFALATSDTEFIHMDFNEGKRVLAWRRGPSESSDQVVVVANFSDWGTSDPWNPRSEYVVPNWPDTPDGKSWREITLNRPVPGEWVGREPLFPWEGKVYATV
ncbi:MAG TPA: alpha-amylase family glycosyl hydrolase [Methanotrichaceae archaeon]|nr:alpha-amylase family glycosyl hydrolase [Methanotrichaceae archaeon]